MARVTQFYAFDLDAHVPPNRVLRETDRFLDMGVIPEKPKPFYSHMGRPSSDPERVVRALAIDYAMVIRSERRLCEEGHPNLACRWFRRPGLDDKVTDHSFLFLCRHGKCRESELLHHIFEATVERCMKEDLISDEGFAVDASLIPADANRARSCAAREWNEDVARAAGNRAAKEHPETRDDAAFGAASPVQSKFIAKSDPGPMDTGHGKPPQRGHGRVPPRRHRTEPQTARQAQAQDLPTGSHGMI